jgi:hypothetical protein
LPKLHPLLLHAVEGKEWSLKLFLYTLEEMKAEDRKLKNDPYFEGHWKTQYPSEADLDMGFEGFDQAEIREAKIRLKKMSALNEKLRKFLATEFTIEDLSMRRHSSRLRGLPPNNCINRSAASEFPVVPAMPCAAPGYAKR